MLLTCINLPSVIEIFVLSIFKLPLKTGFTVCPWLSSEPTVNGLIRMGGYPC